MTQKILGAVQFLTVVPVPGNAASPGGSAALFPLAGALLGASSGGVFLAASVFLGPSLASLIALAWLLAVTGCLHEDGLADVADAVRAGRTRERMMAILKDSRIGVYGALALIVSVAIRWQSLAQMQVAPLAGMTAALALSRTSLVVLAGIAPVAGDGMGAEFARSCSGPVVLFCIAQAVAISSIVGVRAASGMVLSSALTVLLARIYFVRRLGGVNGDCLGATCQAVETVNMVILACRPSF